MTTSLEVATPVADMFNQMADCMQRGGVPALMGPPGVGKTAGMAAEAKRRGLEQYVIIGSQCDPTDLNGFPVVDTDTSVVDSQQRSHPVLKFAPRRIFIDAVQRPSQILLDEFTCASAATQAAMLRGINERQFGEFYVDPEVVQLAILYNPPEVATNGTEISLPAANRLEHFTMPEFSSKDVVEEWCDGFLRYWGDPPKIQFVPNNPSHPSHLKIPERVFRVARSMVVGYLLSNPSQLAPKRSVDSANGVLAFPTPRSWEKVARAIALCLHRDQPVVQAYKATIAAVGTGAATPFHAFMERARLPDPEQLLAQPDSYVPTGEIDTDFVTLDAVAAAVVSNDTLPRQIAAWKVLRRAAGVSDGEGKKIKARESAVSAVRQLVPLVRSLTKVDNHGKIDPQQVADAIKTVTALSAPYSSLFKSLMHE